MDGVEKEYNLFIEKNKDKVLSSEEIDRISRSRKPHEHWGLDFVDVHWINSDNYEYFSLDPNCSCDDNYILSSLESCFGNDEVHRNIVSRADIVRKALPDIIHLVPGAIREKEDISCNNEFFSPNYKPCKYEKVVSIMNAVESGSDLELDYNWGA